MNLLRRNIAWTLADRLGRLLIALASGILVTRMLQPQIYGVLNYANALVGIVAFLNISAIESLVALSLAQHPEEKDKILGSAMLLRLLGAATTVAVVLVAGVFLDAPSQVSCIAPIIASASLFSALDVGDFWLRQILDSKIAVLSRLIALSIGGAARVWAAAQPDPLPLLALTTVMESCLVAVGLTVALNRVGTAPWLWRVDWPRCRQIFTSALPLLLAAAAVGIYARAGVIILGESVSAHAVGMFGVATFMAEATHVLPTAIMGSVGPQLLGKYSKSSAQFSRDFFCWLSRVFWLGAIICGLLYWSADLIVSQLFGTRYVDSIETFETLIWSALFVYLSIASEPWIVAKSMQRYQLPKTLLAAALNIALNLNLALLYGAKGAAVATLCSYSVSAFWSNALFKNTRPLFFMQCRAMLCLKFVREQHKPS